MSKNVRKLAIAALCAAVAAAILVLGSMLPTGRLAIAAVAGLATAAALIECGYLFALLQFIAAAVLGILLAPAKEASLLYCLLLGWYPIVKSLFERLRFPWLAYICKAASFALAVAAGYLLIRVGLAAVQIPNTALWALGIAALLGFFVYDFCFTGLTDIYIRRVRGRMKTK